jgi:DNA modification methylase
MFDYRILVGGVIARLSELPNESVHCVVTSPPYWGLRDYGVEGQIGLEPTIDAYVSKMVSVFREVRRVLRGDGTLWLNLGDSYASSSGVKTSHPQQSRNGPQGVVGPRDQHPSASRSNLTTLKEYDGLKPKDRCMIPARVALALQADGWWIRQEIVWCKPNPMPESCTDRPTTAHEMVYLLTKSSRYYYDAEAVREEATCDRVRGPAPHPCKDTNGNDGLARRDSMGTRNRRSWWKIATQSYKEAHFATFPEKLVEPCILAGTSEKGCCPQCGAPWERVVDTESIRTRPGIACKVGTDAVHGDQKRFRRIAMSTTTGWRPGCDCREMVIDSGNCEPTHGDDMPPLTPEPCTVLDPFCGSGTTLLVACQHGRDAVGIELSPEYASLAERRIGQGLRPGTYVDEHDSTNHPLFT